MQPDSCLNSERIDTLLISVGGQEVMGGGVILGRKTVTVRNAPQLRQYVPDAICHLKGHQSSNPQYHSSFLINAEEYARHNNLLVLLVL